VSTTDAKALTATVLVTDLVGSTELRAKVGEDAAEELRRVHDQLLVDAVGRHGGEVVKGLGDGVLARFPGAAEAVAAGVDIQQAAARRSFDIRVGISAGDVTLENGDVFGTPVIEASRLCARADGGQILVAQLVQLLARGRGGHAFTLVGELELKGLPEPVTVAQVTWEAAAADAAVPLPSALAGGDRLLYAGRAAPRTLLRERWKAAMAGDRQVVLVSGEPGMGKTRLAAELAREVHRDGAIVLFGRADEDVDTAHRSITEALRHLVAHAPVGVLEEHVAEHGDALTRLVPELLRRVPDAPPAPRREDDRVALFDAAADLIGRTAATAPILLVLDDLHWADHASLLFLRHLVRAPAIPLLVVGTYRDTDLSRTHPLAAMLADLRRERNVERLDLPGLDGGEITELMAVNAGHDLTDEAVRLAEVIHGETGGNPFFVGEILTHLVESGTIYERDGRWTSDNPGAATLGVPEGVREVIGRRLSALSPEADKAMRTAAAVGQEVDLRVLGHMLDTDVEQLLDVLDEPLQRGLLAEVSGAIDRVRFAHALVRQALYEELSASRRVRLHHRVSTALAATGRGNVAERAHHACEAAVVAGAEEAIELAVAAAVDAEGQFAWEQAAGWYRRALDAEESIDEPDAARRARLLIALAEARNAAGAMLEAREEALAAADLARRVGDVELLAGAAIAYGGGLGAWLDPRDVVGLALASEAERMLPAGDSLLRVMLLLRRSGWLVTAHDPAERLAVTAEAVAMARRLGDRSLIALALGSRGDVVRALPEATELMGIARELGELTGHAPAAVGLFDFRYWMAAALVIEGRFTEAGALTKEWLEIADRIRSRTAKWNALNLAASLALVRGRFDDLSRWIEQVRELAPSMGDVGAVVVETTEVNVLLHTNPWGGWVERHPALEARTAAIVGVSPWRAIAAAHDGDRERASAELARWEEEELPHVPSWVVGPYIAVASPAARGLAPALAERMYQGILHHDGRWIAAGYEAITGHSDVALGRYAAAAGRLDEGIDRLERGIAEHDRAGEVPVRALAVVDLAELLLERGSPGDADRARALAREALAVAERIGLPLVTQRAAALL